MPREKMESNERPHTEPILEQNQTMVQFNGSTPPEHWDPNEDIASDFMEANGSFVAETQIDQRGEGKAQRLR